MINLAPTFFPQTYSATKHRLIKVKKLIPMIKGPNFDFPTCFPPNFLSNQTTTH